MVGLLVNSKMSYANLHLPEPCCQSHCPWNRLLLTHTSAGDSQILTGRSGSVFCGVTTPFLWVLVLARFCLCPPCLCFPKSCGSSVIKSFCTSKPQSLCQISRLGSLICSLEPSQQSENFFGILFSSSWVAHLSGMGFDFIMIAFLLSYCNFSLVLGCVLCFCLFVLMGFNVLLSMVLQQ